MVRRAERPACHQLRAAFELAGHGVYLGCLEGFGQGQRRHDRRQAFRQHRFARAGRADQQDVVATCAGHFESALDAFLAFDFAEIEVKLLQRAGEFGAGVEPYRLGSRGAGEEIGHLAQRVKPVDVEIVDHGSLGGVFSRYDDAAETLSACFDGHGQHAVDGPQRAVERQLAQQDIFVEIRCLYQLRAGHQRDGYGQVIGRAFLLDIRRGHVHHHSRARQRVARLLDGRDDTLMAFPDGSVGQSDDAELHAAADRYLYGHRQGIDAYHGSAVSLYQHVSPLYL